MITPLPLPCVFSILTTAGLTCWMIAAREGGGVSVGTATGVFASAGVGTAANVARILASIVASMLGASVGNAAAIAASTVSGIFGVCTVPAVAHPAIAKTLMIGATHV